MTYKAAQIAEWIVAEATRQGLKITPMQLQKILYYCQGEHLGMTGKPLFNEPVLAWVHGPVVRSVYDLYRRFGKSPIAPNDSAAPDEIAGLIRHCVKEKGSFSASVLREMTHSETPYLSTPHNEEITPEVIKDFFEKKFYDIDEEDIYMPEYHSEDEAMKAASEQFTEDELDELISAL